MILIDDRRFREESIPIDELQAEVQELLGRDIADPSGEANIVISILRRHPTIPENVALQVAILEGEAVRRQRLIDLSSWMLGGQLFFSLLGKLASK